jgi:hypothetical protein
MTKSKKKILEKIDERTFWAKFWKAKDSGNY